MKNYSTTIEKNPCLDQIVDHKNKCYDELSDKIQKNVNLYEKSDIYISEDKQTGYSMRVGGTTKYVGVQLGHFKLFVCAWYS